MSIGICNEHAQRTNFVLNYNLVYSTIFQLSENTETATSILAVWMYFYMLI